MPEGFESYVRILHPAYINVGRESRNVPVPWSLVGKWSGKSLKATTHLYDLMIRSDGHDWRRRGEGGDEPNQGGMDGESLSCLLEHLARSTRTPKEVWLLIWFGYGGSEDTIGLPIEVSEQLTGSGRKYFLRRGAVVPSRLDSSAPMFERPPSFWWSADRSWFVSCDIDSSSTYVGGTNELIERILHDPFLEAFPAELDDPYGGLYVNNVVVQENDGYVPPRRRFKDFLRRHLSRPRRSPNGSAYILRRVRWWEWWLKP